MSSRRHLAAVVVAVAAAASALAAPAAATAASTPSPSAASADPGPADSEPGAFSPDIQLSVAASRDYPDTFAGLWVDDTGVLNIAFTQEGQESLRRLRSKVSGLDTLQVEVRPASRSLAELAVDANRVSAEVARLQESGVVLTQIGPDLASNRLIARVAGDTAAASAILRRQYPTMDLQVVAGQLSELAVCDTRQVCRPDIRGGAEIFRTTSSTTIARCSAGFQAYHRDTRAPALITAGHCAPNKAAIYQGDGTKEPALATNQVGTTTFSSYKNSELDSAVIPMGLTWTTNNQVWLPGNKTYPITSSIPSGGEVVGRLVHKSGVTTNQTSGKITATGQNLSIDENGDGVIDFTLYQHTTAAVCGLPGDSGGSILESNRAYGVVSTSRFRRNADGTVACFTDGTQQISWSPIYKIDPYHQHRIRTS